VFRRKPPRTHERAPPAAVACAGRKVAQVVAVVIAAKVGRVEANLEFIVGDVLASLQSISPTKVGRAFRILATRFGRRRQAGRETAQEDTDPFTRLAKRPRLPREPLLSRR
jgi:hypothetical protein